MDDALELEQHIAIAYQSGMEDGSRLRTGMDDDEITTLAIARGEQWAAAVGERGPYPDRL